MKLAEALAERSDCQNRLQELQKRLIRNARVQEGEQPAEDPAALLAEVERVQSRLLYLVLAINRPNSAITVDGKQTLSDALAERDLTAKKRDLLSSLIDAASTRQDRYSKSEVKFVATVSVGPLQKQVDEYAKRYRELDTNIQELNWKTDLA